MGSKAEFEEMNRFISERKMSFSELLVPEMFSFADAKAAYSRLESGKFTGKIVIKVAE